jgi:hypothetical protein
MCPVLSLKTSAVMWRTYIMKIAMVLYGRSKLEHSLNTKEPRYIHSLWRVSWICTVLTLYFHVQSVKFLCNVHLSIIND